MTRIPPQSPRFSGYRLTPGGQARLFLPGYGGARVEAEALLPGGDYVTPVRLKREGDYWVSQNPLPLGAAYRFKVNGETRFDHVQKVQRSIQGETQAFNLISPHEAVAPRKSSVIADIYLDSLVTPEKLKQLASENGGVLPMRNHFNLWQSNPAGIEAASRKLREVGQEKTLPDLQEAGLLQLMPQLRESGFSALLFKPFIGGDDLSSHKYWTIDPYVLNGSFTHKRTFKFFLNQMLRNGMKLYADGAFVNQGLNGVQMMSNLAHGFRSPFWDWFTYEENAKPAGMHTYPKHAFEKFTFGVLPTRLEPDTGSRTVDYDRFAVRILNEPDREGYDAHRPTFVELYDPRLETNSGEPVRPPLTDEAIKNSEDSVQKYRFPVSVEEVRDKQKALADVNSRMSEVDKKKLLSEWKAFRLGPATSDDSSFKWDGQIDVAKMNIKNPEVVDYLDGAVGYWSRFVSNTYIDTVARALAGARARNPSAHPAQWIEAITQPTDSRGERSGLQVLPPVTMSEVETLSRAEVDEQLQNARTCEKGSIASTLTDTLMAEYPLNVLPLPTLFKATLSYPGLQKVLREQPPTGWQKFVSMVLTPLSALPLLGALFSKMKQALLPLPFEILLTQKLNETIRLLQPEVREKLRTHTIQSLMSEPLGEALFMKIFTGMDADQAASATPGEIEKAFYGTMRADLLKADPETASKLLPGFMKTQLAKIEPIEIARLLDKHLHGLDPKLSVIAEAVLQKREYGLNWRIDAAKDVADMDKVRNADKADRAPLFEEEIEFVKTFWDRLGNTIRSTFPKSAIIAELTDFELLSNDDVAKAQMNKLFDGNTFTSTPNMRYLYSQLHQLVHYAQRPDEFGAAQMSPSDFAKYTIEEMSQTFSQPAVRQLQNLTSSHDYSTSSHALLVNPALFTYDHLKWWGLKDDLNEACAELLQKECFSQLRRDLNIPMLDKVLEKLKSRVDTQAVRNNLPEELQNFFDEKAKKPNSENQDSANWTATPAALKGRFVDAVFAEIPAAELGLTRLQAERLQAALRSRISEASEAKAMRAVIVNTMLNFKWDDLCRQAALTERQQHLLEQNFAPAMWQALDKTIAQWGRHFGYQPLDIALDHVFKNLELPQADMFPLGFDVEAFKREIKSRLYVQAQRPVLEKLLRMFAVQTAIPGNPSVYLQDLFAQGGSEFVKNIFVQNRNLIRLDKLENDPDFQDFFKRAGEIFQLRNRLPVLNDGVVLPVPADNENGILPVVRDNGQQQVITLVNTGKPSELKWQDGKVGQGLRYAEVTSANPVVFNYRPNLSALKLAAGTRYRDAQTGELFVLNGKGVLESLNRPGQGMDIHISRTLVREAELPSPNSDSTGVSNANVSNNPPSGAGVGSRTVGKFKPS